MKNDLLLSIYTSYYKETAITAENQPYYYNFMKVYLQLNDFDSAIVIYEKLQVAERLDFIHFKIILEFLNKSTRHDRIDLFDKYYSEMNILDLDPNFQLLGLEYIIHQRHHKKIINHFL